jgi:hypothetical protein
MAKPVTEFTQFTQFSYFIAREVDLYRVGKSKENSVNSVNSGNWMEGVVDHGISRTLWN